MGLRQGGRDGRRFSAIVPATVLGSSHGDNAVEITVTYDAGGINYFSGGRDPRGFNLIVQAVKADPDGCVSFSVGSGTGRRFYLEAADKYNARRLARLAEAIDHDLAAIAAAGSRQAWTEIRSILEAGGIGRRAA